MAYLTVLTSLYYLASMNRLLAWRITNGRTQKWVADETGISQSQISKYELGELKPSRSNALKLEALCGISPSAWDEKTPQEPRRRGRRRPAHFVRKGSNSAAGQ